MNSQNLDQILSGMWQQLTLADAEFTSLEHAPFDADLANRILLTIHAIEKNCQTLGLRSVRGIASRAANVLAHMRDGLLAVNPENISLLRDAICEMKELVGWVEATGSEPRSADGGVAMRLDQSADDAGPLIVAAASSGNSPVLVVDGSMFFRNLLSVALEGRRCTVTAVESAPAAIELFQQGEAFQAVVSEIDLPKMSGCEFAHWIRNQASCRQTPLIALTAAQGPGQKSRALSAGFDCFLTKFNARQLYSAMDDVLSHAAVIDDRMCA